VVAVNKHIQELEGLPIAAVATLPLRLESDKLDSQYCSQMHEQDAFVITLDTGEHESNRMQEL
jgi:hypothetical protein